MDHAYFKDRLSALFDNELPPQEKQIVEEHFNGCAECQAMLAKLRQFEDAVTRHSQLADTDYWEKSAQKIEQRLGFEQQTVITPIRHKWYEKGTGWKMVAAAASIAVIAYIGINSDKILKREDLSPKPTMQAPSVAPSEPKREIVVDSVAKVQEQKDITTTTKVAEPKGITDKQDVLDLKTMKKVSPEAGIPPQPTPKDVNLADKDVVKEQEVYLPAPDQKPQTNQYAAGRAAPAPGVSSEQAAKSAPMPIADSAGADIRDEAREVALAQIDSVASDSTLSFWRKKRDVLENVRMTIPDMFGMLEKRAAAPSSLQQKEKPADTAAPKLTQQETEKQLLEAWYNIAKLTSEKTERDKAVAYIRKVADDRRSPNRSFAVRYMQELGER